MLTESYSEAGENALRWSLAGFALSRRLAREDMDIPDAMAIVPVDGELGRNAR